MTLRTTWAIFCGVVIVGTGIGFAMFVGFLIIGTMVYYE